MMRPRSRMIKEDENRRIVTYKAVVVDGVDVLLLGHHVTKAATGRVLEGDAGGLGPQDAVDIITIVVGLEEWPPHLQEVQVPDRRNHDVQLILQ
ncbi:unnamed protein product [Spirodela intermedia]|uniref:Uncharacterized protein n=1 Tax=Spirodela intermedia TaxID=51605 RepID=A0A7I8JD93_SPIIN|nr:unnamed protein product [Spirodela intermedia]CAA6667352.1 unnamed protein product [Spirodela intermedia]